MFYDAKIAQLVKPCNKLILYDFGFWTELFQFFFCCMIVFLGMKLEVGRWKLEENGCRKEFRLFFFKLPISFFRPCLSQTL